ncbi:hypothetical protein MNBD_NITROSPINAE03-202 [hydrothermal vent metagenome]|uniref:Uncharacterized protein n=1 Tax=hydrothermal vent metagenome TaxID=652676 RepID=A0A3B1CJ29_9ZZZZ
MFEWKSLLLRPLGLRAISPLVKGEIYFPLLTEEGWPSESEAGVVSKREKKARSFGDFILSHRRRILQF